MDLPVVAFLLLTPAATTPAARAVEVNKNQSVQCPVGETTRIAFPEEVVDLELPAPEALHDLGFRVVEEKPRLVIALTPRRAGLSADLDFEGQNVRLRLQLVSVAATAPSPPVPPGAKPSPTEGRSPATSGTLLTRPAAGPSPVPTSTLAAVAPTPSPLDAPPPTTLAAAPKVEPPSTTIPLAPSTTVADPHEPEATPVPIPLSRVEPRDIGRQEGLAGQRPMVLSRVYVPREGNESLGRAWLEFVLKGGASERVSSVTSSNGPSPFDSARAGKDLIVTVEVPIALLEKGWMEVHVASGAKYRFTQLSSPTLWNSVKHLVK